MTNRKFQGRTTKTPKRFSTNAHGNVRLVPGSGGDFLKKLASWPRAEQLFEVSDDCTAPDDAVAAGGTAADDAAAAGGTAADDAAAAGGTAADDAAAAGGTAADYGRVHELPGCQSITPGPCTSNKFSSEKFEQVVHFRQTLPLEELQISNWPNIPLLTNDPQFSCAKFAHNGLRAVLGLDLRFEQRWKHRNTLVGPLSASFALAPTETLSLTVRNTQRKQFDQETLDETEKMSQTETATSDKEAINVTHASSRTNNWLVSGNGSVSLPLSGRVGLNASMSSTVNASVNSSSQQTYDATSKSATNLKNLHKVVIKQTTETTDESVSSRRIVNPYRDRSLRIDAYEMLKEYCIEFHHTGLSPVMVFDLGRLSFNAQFVRNNGAFLFDELTDRMLESDLGNVFATISTAPSELSSETKAQDFALLALEYLFIRKPMFNIVGTPINGLDNNDPASSFFDFPLGRSNTGLGDATDNNLGVIFTILGFYFKLYMEQVRSDLSSEESKRIALDLVLSLERTLAPKWLQVEETSSMNNVLDATELTEAFRRLSGFLTFASGVVRPLISPIEEERDARDEVNRAAFVVQRVVEHLNCHGEFYTRRFLHYMANQTRNAVVVDFAKDMIQHHLGAAGILATFLFDAHLAFLEASSIVVPMRRPLEPAEVSGFLTHMDRAPDRLTLGLRTRLMATVPTDGFHIEAVPGQCCLPDISGEPTMGPVRLSVQNVTE
ncbi:hypothetical protein HC749_14245 [Arthrobacter sp. S13_S34]|nr:hypothetical protein [Arthrobacter sp. S13_S34]